MSVNVTRLASNEAVRENLSNVLPSIEGKPHSEQVTLILNAISPFVRLVDESWSHEEYMASEQENENLRSHVFWVAEHLSPPIKRALVDRLIQPLDKGGIVDACDDETSPLRRLIRSV